MKKNMLREYGVILGIIILVGGVGFAFSQKSNSSAIDETVKRYEEKVNEKNNETNKKEETESSKGENTGTEKTESSKNFDLTNAVQTIIDKKVEVSITKAEYKGNTLTVSGQVDNNSGEEVSGHVSKFYLKDSDDNITKLDFFANPTFNIQAPTGGKTKFEMVFNNINLDGNKITVGGEFFKLSYFGSDNKINLDIKY